MYKSKFFFFILLMTSTINSILIYMVAYVH